MFNKLLSLLQWAIFSFAALGMFAISLVRGLILKVLTVLHQSSHIVQTLQTT